MPEAQQTQLNAGTRALSPSECVRSCLAALDLDANPSALLQKFAAIKFIAPDPAYKDDPYLPKIGNEIRARLSGPERYFTKMPDANSLPTQIHEEYHSLNADHQNIGHAVVNERWNRRYNDLLERKVASASNLDGAAIALTPAETESLGNTNCFAIYIPQFRSAVGLSEPYNVGKLDGLAAVPEALRSPIVIQYLEKMANEGPTSSVLDEGGAYFVDARAALALLSSHPELYRADDDPSRARLLSLMFRDRNPTANGVPLRMSAEVSSCLDISVVMLAQAKAIADKEPNYFNQSGFRELSAFLVRQNVEAYRVGKDVHALNLEGSEEYAQKLFSGPEGKPLRDFARRAYGEKWYSEVFAPAVELRLPPP